MSTLCELCTDLEYEIGMGDEASQVGRCVHGVEDEIIEDEIKSEFFEDGAGRLSFTDEIGAGIVRFCDG